MVDAGGHGNGRPRSGPAAAWTSVLWRFYVWSRGRPGGSVVPSAFGSCNETERAVRPAAEYGGDLTTSGCVLLRPTDAPPGSGTVSIAQATTGDPSPRSARISSAISVA